MKKNEMITKSVFEKDTDEKEFELSKSIQNLEINKKSIKSLISKKKEDQSHERKTSFCDFTFKRDSMVRDMFLNHLPGPNENRFIKKESIEQFRGSSNYKKQPVFVDLKNQMRII